MAGCRAVQATPVHGERRGVGLINRDAQSAQAVERGLAVARWQKAIDAARLPGPAPPAAAPGARSTCRPAHGPGHAEERPGRTDAVRLMGTSPFASGGWHRARHADRASSACLHQASQAGQLRGTGMATALSTSSRLVSRMSSIIVTSLPATREVSRKPPATIFQSRRVGRGRGIGRADQRTGQQVGQVADGRDQVVLARRPRAPADWRRPPRPAPGPGPAPLPRCAAGG